MAWCIILILVFIQLVYCVEFSPKCVTNLITQHYGYNISCRFNITVYANTIYHVSLNWSVPSQTSFIFDNNTQFIGGQNPTNVYQNTPLIVRWDAINASTTASVILHLTPNTSISINEAVISTASLQYYNLSNTTITSPSLISKSVLIQFSTPSNDGPTLSASSYSLSTTEDVSVTANVYVSDPDFYELSADALMSVNISVINGTITLTKDFGGIYFLTGSGTNSSDIHMLGSLHSINHSLNEVTFIPRKNTAGSAQIIISVSDEGNTGTGAVQTASITININITQIYEIPNINAPSSKIIIHEDSTLNLAQINCSVTKDVDPHYGWLQLLVTSLYGSFSFDGTITPNRTSFGTHSITINDTAQLLSSYLQNITYHPVENFNEESDDIEVISLQLTDHADLEQSKQFEVVIESVNDAPTINIASRIETNEDTDKEFNIVIEDIDCDVTWGATMNVILRVSNGTLSLNSRKGLRFMSGDWQTSKSIEFTASKTNINYALYPVIYHPLLNYFGNDTLVIMVSDNGYTGNYGGTQWTNASIPITVNESNGNDLVPIINGFNAPFTCFEDVVCFINNVSFHIANAEKQHKTNFTAYIAVTDQMGFISLNPYALHSVQFMIGNGSMDEIMQFKGNYTNINKALHNITFISTLNNHGYQGEIYLNISNAYGDTSLVTNNLYIDAMNDAPIIHKPYNSITIDEDHKLQIVGITLEDVDINDTFYGHFYCNITCLHGTIKLHSIEGIQFIDSTADESDTIHMFSRAGLVQIALSTLEYAPNSHYVGMDLITIHVNDDGNTGNGGTLSDTQSINITIENVVDPPIPLCANVSLFGVEDTMLHIVGIDIIDTDNVTLNDTQHLIYIRFTLLHGTILNVSTIYSVDESVDSYAWQGLLTGSDADIRDALRNITYNPFLNYNKVCCGHETLWIAASYNSTFDDLVAECNIDIYISSVNDAPTVDVDTTQTVMEDDTLTLGIEVNDVDVTEDPSNGLFHVSLSATAGIIDCVFWSGSWAHNGSSGTHYVEIVGSTAHVMDTVRTCKFSPYADFAGNCTVEVCAWDNGLSGEIGEPQNITTLISIEVISVADAPRIFLQYPNYTQAYQIFMDEDTNLTMNFTVWEVDQVPFHSDLNGSIFTFSSIFGTISSKYLDPIYWFSETDSNGSLIAQCIHCNGSTHKDLSIEYIPHLNANSKQFGNEVIQIHTQDVDGSTNNVNYYITVQPINDEVVMRCHTEIVFGYEDIPIAFNLSAYDPDSDENGGLLWLSIVSINGSFYFDFQTTPRFVQHEGDITANSSRLVGETTLNGLNIILRDLRFMSDPNYYGNASIVILVSDQGEYGIDGTIYEANCTQHITLYPVNDALIVYDPLNYIIDIAEDRTSFIEGIMLIDNDTTIDYVYSLLIEFESAMRNISFPNELNQAYIMDVNAYRSIYTITHLNYSTIQSLIANISVSPIANYNGFMQMKVQITSNDTSQINTQYAISQASITHIVHIHGVNDPPIIEVMPSNLSIDEDACGFIQISVSDIDFDEFQENQIRTKYATGWIQSINCTFSIPDYYGLNYVEGEPFASSFFKFHCGSLDVLNKALSAIEICSSIDDFYGNALIYFNISDNAYSYGNTSVYGVSDAPLSDQIVVPVIIDPVVDVVEITMKSKYNGSEDIWLPFAIGIYTPDVIKPDLEITITSHFGNISTNESGSHCTETLHALQCTANWSFCTGVLSNLVYKPDLNWNGYDDHLTITVNITSTQQMSSDTATVYIAAVNDPITILYTSSNFTSFEDEWLRIKGLSIHDLDALDHSLQLITATINCSGGNGYIALSTFDGLEYVQGNDTKDTMIDIKGGFEHIRHALESDILFHPYDNWFGQTNITLKVSDEGFTGYGPAYTDLLVVDITVVSTSDRPIFDIGSDAECEEDMVCYVFGGNVSDVDSDLFQIEIFVENGLLTLYSLIGLSFERGNGTNDKEVIFNGSALNINTAISNITYRPNKHFNGHDTVTMTCTDFDTALLSHYLDLHIIAVNDAPQITVGVDVFNALDSVPVAIRDISVSDVDFYETSHALCACNVSANNGTVSLGAMESVNRASGSGYIHLLTDLDELNDALALHLMYESAEYFEGLDVITIIVDDLGNTGDGTSLIDIQTINITVDGVNHEPVLNKSIDMIQLKQHETAMFDVIVYDEDCLRHPNIMCNLTLSIRTNKGSIMSDNCPYLTSNAFTKQMVIHGNISEINQCATNITFAVLSNWNGIKGYEIEISLNDNGYYGNGDPFYVNDNIAVNISHINHELRMLNTVSIWSYSVSNGYSLPLNGLQIQDLDLNVTNTELLLMNISVDYNMISLYALNGLHFIHAASERFSRTSRYSQLDFYGTIYSINQALPYLYFHSNKSFCGMDTVIVTASYDSEIVNTSLNINVTCS